MRPVLVRQAPVRQAPVALAPRLRAPEITLTAHLVDLVLQDPEPVDLVRLHVPVVLVALVDRAAEALVGPVVGPVEFDLDSPLVLVLMAPAPVAPVVPVVLVAPVPLPLVEVLALALLAVALPLAVALLVEHPVVLAVPAVPAAEALVVEVRQVRSESKAESRARRARARRCAAKSSTICKLPSLVASSSLVVMDQPRFACHVALRSLTLLIASMQTQRCSLPRSFTSVKWSTQRSR